MEGWNSNRDRLEVRSLTWYERRRTVKRRRLPVSTQHGIYANLTATGNGL